MPQYDDNLIQQARDTYAHYHREHGLPPSEMTAIGCMIEFAGKFGGNSEQQKAISEDLSQALKIIDQKDKIILELGRDLEETKDLVKKLQEKPSKKQTPPPEATDQ